MVVARHVRRSQSGGGGPRAEKPMSGFGNCHPKEGCQEGSRECRAQSHRIPLNQKGGVPGRCQSQGGPRGAGAGGFPKKGSAGPRKGRRGAYLNQP